MRARLLTAKTLGESGKKYLYVVFAGNNNRFNYVIIFEQLDVKDVKENIEKIPRKAISRIFFLNIYNI